jgi:phosphoribosylanthranilate isomerase
MLVGRYANLTSYSGNLLMIKIKICGITRIEDAQLAQDLGAWAIGFVFYPKSPRYITPEKACEISKNLDVELHSRHNQPNVFGLENPTYFPNQSQALNTTPHKIKKIGVFVNENPEIINQITQTVRLDYVQLHGNESAEDCAKLTVPFIKTIRNINEIKIYSEAFAYLIDATDTQNWGGTGKLADWEFAKTVKEKQPITPTLSRKGRGCLKPLILSGGLSSANIKEALQTVNPDFIDLSSSLETQPGIKNHLTMQEFFDKVKEQYE